MRQETVTQKIVHERERRGERERDTEETKRRQREEE